MQYITMQNANAQPTQWKVTDEVLSFINCPGSTVVLATVGGGVAKRSYGKGRSPPL